MVNMSLVRFVRVISIMNIEGIFQIQIGNLPQVGVKMKKIFETTTK